MIVLEWLTQNIIGLLTLIAVGIGTYHLREKVRTLETTVSSQEASMRAQTLALQGLQGLVSALDKLDLPQWVERYQAHAKLVDQETAAKVAAVQRQAESALADARREAEAAQNSLALVEGIVEGLTSLALAWMRFARLPDRLAAIDIAGLPEHLDQALRAGAKTIPEPEPTLSQLLGPLSPAPSQGGLGQALASTGFAPSN
jgi:hypothetical protein